MSTLANLHPSEALTPEATPAEATAPPAPPSPGAQVRWLREPLLHFVVLGGLLFAGDHLLVSRADDPRTIVVGPAVDSEAVETFEAARGRKPNEEEREALHRVWLDNEVLYREGLALQVDKGDAAIRERVIFKALSVVDSNVKLPPVDEQVLRRWFEQHREKYDEPARYDFDEAVLSGDGSEAAVRAFAADLNAGTPGDAKAGLRVFKGRPHENLVQSYGPALAEALVKAKPGEWQALATTAGWRVVRLNSITAPKPAVFDNLRGVVLQDWKDAIASEQRSLAVRELTKKYKIKYESAEHGSSPE
ncbi:MAG: peptidylprolyl isomerase [Myxococcales bacterium]